MVYGKSNEIEEHLKIFGEMGVVTKSKIQVNNRGQKYPVLINEIEKEIDNWRKHNKNSLKKPD